MNHLRSLQVQLDAANAHIAELRAGIANIENYVRSDKFAQPGELAGYVNTLDVYTRCRETTSAGIDAENAAWVESACRLDGHAWEGYADQRAPRQCTRCHTYELVDHPYQRGTLDVSSRCQHWGCAFPYSRDAHPITQETARS